jgi:hypothetical protein
MWHCPSCREQLEDSQGECWNCGTAADGSKNPEFDRALWEREADGDYVRVANEWHCPSCPEAGFTIRDSPTLMATMTGKYRWFVLVVCDACGFSEDVERRLPFPSGGEPVRILR